MEQTSDKWPTTQRDDLYGARNASYLAGLPTLKERGLRSASVPMMVRPSSWTCDRFIKRDTGSDDWSYTPSLLLRTRKMMEAVAENHIGCASSLPVSLETPMACGIGICFSCVTPIKQKSRFGLSSDLCRRPCFRCRFPSSGMFNSRSSLQSDRNQFFECIIVSWELNPGRVE